MKLDTRVVAAVLLIVAVVTGAATISAYTQSRRASALEAELAQAEATQAKLANQLKVAMAEARQLKASQEALATQDAEAEPVDSTESPVPASEEREDSTVQRKFAYVEKAFMKGQIARLALDYASFLTDPDAVKAATKKAGDDYPPPTDYYVYNPSAKLREFPIADDATITIMLNGPEDTESLSPAEFVDAFSINTDNVADAGYWVTVEDGQVTRLVEQWTP